MNKKWLYARLFIIASGALSGITVTSPESVASSNMNWTACLIIFVAIPFMLLAVVGFQVINPWSAPTWKRPSWYINPFSVKQPLQFFHLASFSFMAGGLVGLATVPFRGVLVAPLAVFLFSVGAGAWIGVWLCTKVYKNKIEKDFR